MLTNSVYILSLNNNSSDCVWFSTYFPLEREPNEALGCLLLFMEEMEGSDSPRVILAKFGELSSPPSQKKQTNQIRDMLVCLETS